MNSNPSSREVILEDGIRDVERSRGLGDVYKRQLSVLALEEGVNSNPSSRAVILEDGIYPLLF